MGVYFSSFSQFHFIFSIFTEVLPIFSLFTTSVLPVLSQKMPNCTIKTENFYVYINNLGNGLAATNLGNGLAATNLGNGLAATNLGNTILRPI